MLEDRKINTTNLNTLHEIEDMAKSLNDSSLNNLTSDFVGAYHNTYAALNLSNVDQFIYSKGYKLP